MKSGTAESIRIAGQTGLNKADIEMLHTAGRDFSLPALETIAAAGGSYASIAALQKDVEERALALFLQSQESCLTSRGRQEPVLDSATHLIVASGYPVGSALLECKRLGSQGVVFDSTDNLTAAFLSSSKILHPNEGQEIMDYLKSSKLLHAGTDFDLRSVSSLLAQLGTGSETLEIMKSLEAGEFNFSSLKDLKESIQLSALAGVLEAPSFRVVDCGFNESRDVQTLSRLEAAGGNFKSTLAELKEMDNNGNQFEVLVSFFLCWLI